jgi:hypothetical protein
LNRPNHNRGVKINLTQNPKETKAKPKKPKQNQYLSELDKFEEELSKKTFLELKQMIDQTDITYDDADIQNKDDVDMYKSMLIVQEFYARMRIPLDPVMKSSIEMCSKMCREHFYQANSSAEDHPG